MCDPDKMKPEPIPGLPEELPPGERLLWRGSPNWRSLALHVFHVRAIAIYFGALMIWRVTEGVAAGGEPAAIAVHALSLAPAAVGVLALVSLLAWLIARATIYTVTSERVVIRAGVALPKAINIPFAIIGSAALRLRKDGDGDIPLQLTGPDRAAYLHLWPHARPWRLHKAEPMLRGVPDAAGVAQILAGALAAKAGQSAPRISTAAADEPRAEAVPPRAAAVNL
jgi:hypothetical protein